MYHATHPSHAIPVLAPFHEVTPARLQTLISESLISETWHRVHGVLLLLLVILLLILEEEEEEGDPALVVYVTCIPAMYKGTAAADLQVFFRIDCAPMMEFNSKIDSNPGGS